MVLSVSGTLVASKYQFYRRGKVSVISEVYPHLVNRLSQVQIASYLGITLSSKPDAKQNAKV
jgi:hypothetical protein